MNTGKPLFWNNKNLISLSLIPFSIITFIINLFKNFLLKKNFKIKTICIGNIYVGGTGKTSLSIEINNILKKKFKTVFIKKKYMNQFDERELLKTNGNVFSDTDRKISLIKAVNTRKFNLAILDDGLQDKTIKYDISIACFNTSYGIGNGLLIPAGPLRENLSILRNYSAIFLNGEKYNKSLISILKEFNNHIFYSNYFPTNIRKFNRKKKYLCFCGIGNPEEFKFTLKKYKFNIAKKFIFPDHYNFKNQEIDEIKKIAFDNKLKIITTEKDYKRLNKRNRKNIDYLKIKLKIKNQNKFTKFLKERL
tara:strand:+ start:1225 stop:2145 length:921 start_codon:yes stop_codon:yes gene_type:complete